MSKLLGGNGSGEPGWGAIQEWSIYWQFIPAQYYNSLEFLYFTKYAMIFLNVWHFFVRKGALMRCIRNLNPLNIVKAEESDLRFSLECLLIGNMCGIIVVPGAHSQFQFWYTYSIPILLSLLPLQHFMLPLCYLYFFPAAQEGSSSHHLFIIAMTLYLVFVGSSSASSADKKSDGKVEVESENKEKVE